MKHFTLEELTRSDTARRLGLDNAPTAEHAAHLEETVRHLADPLREAWAVHCATERLGTPALLVTSGYRSEAVNKAVGGSSTSAHTVGYALDVVPQNGRLREFKAFARRWLSEGGRAFDQMISEDEDAAGTPGWIHLGYRNTQGEQRRQFLTMRDGRYIPMTR